MKPTKRLLYTFVNILAGGVALISILISLAEVSKPPDALYFYLVGILTWVFASIILLMRPDHDIVRLTYLMSVGFMVICSIGEGRYDGTWKSLIIHVPELASASFLPCLFFWCFSIFPSKKKFAENKFFRYIVYIPGATLFVIMLISYLSGNGYTRSFFLINIKPVLIPNFIFLFGYSITGQLCLLHTWRYGERDGATYTQRKQAKWIFLGISIGLIPLSALHTVPFTLGIDSLLNIGRYSAYTLVAIMICYVIGIIRHRLMAIDLAINKSTVYAIVSSIILASYLVISKFFGNVILNISGKKEIALDLISILIVAMLFAPVKQRVQEIIDRIFDQEKYKYHRIIEGLREELTSIMRGGLDEFAEIVTGKLNEGFKPEFISFLLKNGSDYIDLGSFGNMGELANTLEKLDLNTIGDNPEIIGKKHLLIPLLSKGGKIGIILLGGKVSGREYNREDISMMKTLSHELATGIENARIYDTLRERLKSMEEAYSRLRESIRASNEDFITLDETDLAGLDLMSELGIIAEALVGGSEKLREMDELRSQILADVSHELRTPLTSIKGYAKNLLDKIVGELNEKQMHNIERIYQNCDWLLWLINNLLNLTRIEAGKMDFIPSEVRVSSTINDVISEFMPIARKEEISLMTDCPGDITIIADGDKLRQIISNLVHNAIKFTNKNGKISVRAYDEGDCIQISVKDTGIGISSENTDRIFNRYEKIQNGSGGIGIGLAIVKSLVAIHGGNISVVSEPGIGSCFIISLPKIPSNLVHSNNIIKP